jgi:hypothetical protein
LDEKVKNTTLSSEIKVLIWFSTKPQAWNSVYFVLDIVILQDKPGR